MDKPNQAFAKFEAPKPPPGPDAALSDTVADLCADLRIADLGSAFRMAYAAHLRAVTTKSPLSAEDTEELLRAIRNHLKRYAS